LLGLGGGTGAAQEKRPSFFLYADFEAFIEAYFWDTDFLLEPSTFYQLGAPSRQQLGYRADLFGVLSGLLPHPAELVLKTVEEVEATGPEGEDAHGDV